MTNRDKAIKMLNRIIESRIGLGLSELPDTFNLCASIDELEEMFDNDESLTDINEVALECADSFLDDLD